MKTFHISATNSSREFEGNDNDTVISILSHAAVRSFFGFGTGDQGDIDEALSVLVPHVKIITSGNNSTDVSQLPETFRRAVLEAVLEDGAEIEIDYYAAEDDNANEADQNTQGGFDPAADSADDQDAYDPMDETWRVNGHDTGIPLSDAQAGKFAADKPGKVATEQADGPQGTADAPRHGIVTVACNGGVTRTPVEIEDGVTTVRTVIFSPVVLKRCGMDETAMSNCMVVLNGDIINPNNIHIRKVHAGDTIDITPRYASKLGNE